MQDEWDELTKTFAHVTDRMGRPIDPAIMETVIALNALDIPTVMSCGGHLAGEDDGGFRLPWVDIQQLNPDIIALNNEVARLLDEADEIQKAVEQMRASGGPTHEIKRAQLRVHALHRERHILTREIRIQQAEIRLKLVDYLVQFYNTREAPFDRRLIVLAHGLGRTRLESQGAADFYLAASGAIQQEKLYEYRAEMAAFTDFLKQIYFSQPHKHTEDH
ncbi:MAG TPA: hypothetical protein VKX46_03345 [Ktedonobacteraceae bacterium]|nr:hypothetical protein [Ktedonobacteraceae bacterium]